MVILRGPENDLAEWEAELVKRHKPGRLVFGVPSDAKGLPEALANYEPGKSVTAWVCTGTKCSAPITESVEVIRTLTWRQPTIRAANA